LQEVYLDYIEIGETKKGKELFKILENMEMPIYIEASNDACLNWTRGIDKNGNPVDIGDPKAVKYVVTVGKDETMPTWFHGKNKDGKHIIYQASRMRVLAHEMGHLTGTKDDGGFLGFGSQMNNTNEWENPIMTPIDGITRTGYIGVNPKTHNQDWGKYHQQCDKAEQWR